LKEIVGLVNDCREWLIQEFEDGRMINRYTAIINPEVKSGIKAAIKVKILL